MKEATIVDRTTIASTLNQHTRVMTKPHLRQHVHPPVQQITNIVALVLTIAVNALANLLPLNGVTTGEISDRYASLFTPAGYVFSIWSLIYLLLIVFVVYGALPAQRNNVRLGQLGYAFAWSCLFNIAWLFSWHYGVIWLSELLMLGLLASLIVAYRRLDIRWERSKGLEGWLIDLPFSVYLGWITVATVANTSIFLLELGFDGGSLASTLTVLVIGVATFIGLLALRLRADLAFALVLVWAFVGIAVKQFGQTPGVVVAAFVAAALLALATLWRAKQTVART